MNKKLALTSSRTIITTEIGVLEIRGLIDNSHGETSVEVLGS